MTRIFIIFIAGGKEGVGFHSDQMTYLGPFPTIASLSLGGFPPVIHVSFSSQF